MIASGKLSSSLILHENGKSDHRMGKKLIISLKTCNCSRLVCEIHDVNAKNILAYIFIVSMHMHDPRDLKFSGLIAYTMFYKIW